MSTVTASVAELKTTSLHQEQPKNLVQKWVFRSILLSLLAFISIRILAHPLATNDGPIHVAFAHLILTFHQPGQILQSLVYRLHLRPNPNLAVYFLMAGLMRFVSPALTESIVQVLCIVGPILAAWFAIHSINPRNTWLTILFLPLALNQMLYLGLYNHSLSIAAFFLVVGTYFRLCKAPSYARAAALSACLVLTFFCHASGFVMAFAGLASMSGTAALLSCLRERNLFASIKAQRYTLAAMVAPLPLAAFFLASGGKSPTHYGLKLFDRISQFSRLHLLAVNYPLRDRFPALILSSLLLIAFAVVAVRILLNRPHLLPSRRDQAVGTIVAAFVAALIMLAFPDTMGGGWTHYRRFEIFPYFWMIFTLAFESFSTLLFAGFTAIGASTAIVLIASLFTRQGMIRQQMAPLDSVDHLIGSHCSVAPIVVQSDLLDANSSPDWMDYEPFFQSASRLELHDDRVVLFNYLARLTPYPVHFRPDIEPQEHLFLWKPQQLENEIEKVDLPGFEAGSGLRVDYILLWGSLNRRKPAVQTQVLNALTQFDQIYQSPNGRVQLYKRQGGPGDTCVASPTAGN